MPADFGTPFFTVTGTAGASLQQIPVTPLGAEAVEGIVEKWRASLASGEPFLTKLASCASGATKLLSGMDR
jgi:hypothetical protein